MTFTLANGNTVTATRVDAGFDLHMKNADGETVSTVVVSGAEFAELLPAIR
jgi:hypothetical protein